LAFGLKLGGSSIKWHGSGSSCKHSLNNPHLFFHREPSQLADMKEEIPHKAFTDAIMLSYGQ
jgi:hypothetical protein